ncbi:hypothetical protein WJX73_006419 [Symbiochloris irregularis]|uniref:Uncharacterized protein n=1 Tax=Symbiochloris irregularis TaxID=706552 RepID=A0AAW1NQ24_9CHLO
MVALHQQIVAAASNVESLLTVWDVATGRVLCNFKDSASPPGSLCCLGRDYLVAAQSTTSALSLWSWHKEQRLHRCFAMEPLTAVTASADGSYVFAGGASGSAYIWETSSGRLLRIWPAHYKAATCMALSDGAAVLVTGGGDTLVNAWLLIDLLDCSQDPTAPATPLHSWSEHLLPVTALAVGCGVADPIVASTSLDCTCSIRSLATGKHLRQLCLHSALHSLALDPCEHEIYLGAADGQIHAFSLVSPASDAYSAVCVPQANGNVHSSDHADDPKAGVLSGHAHAVRSLAITPDGSMLISGCDSGSVRIWDLRTRQTLRTLQHCSKGPVTNLVSLPLPPALMARLQSSQPSTSAAAGQQPLAPLAKHLADTMSGSVVWEGPAVQLQHNHTTRQVENSGLLPSEADPHRSA